MSYPNTTERFFRRHIHHHNTHEYHLDYAEIIGRLRRNEPEDVARYLCQLVTSTYPLTTRLDISQLVCLHQMTLIWPPDGLEDSGEDDW